MRTIKRYSLMLNRRKWQIVCRVARSYAVQKDRFLVEYGRPAEFARSQHFYHVQNELVASGYQSSFGLQARMWKLALKDALETVEKQWLSLAEKLRFRVKARQKQGYFSDSQTHYAFWILKSARRMTQLVSGTAPTPKHFEFSREEQRQAANYLRRIIRLQRGRDPRVQITRSFALDAEMYRVFERGGRQYISIMTLVPHKRLVIPLTGRGAIRGNLRIVLDEEKQRVQIHRAVDLRPQPVQGETLAVDFGVTEVITDSDGDRWGKGLGKRLAAYSDQICDKGRRRNRLHALAKKVEERGDWAKGRRIRKYNLGQKKQRRQRRRMRATLECEINRGLNAFWKRKHPAVLVHEDLRGLEGKYKSRRLSRIVRLWTRGLIKDRLAFKASVGCSHREQVNPSYTSQMCPRCGFVHRKNRQGDAFQCLFCGRGGASDVVAAANLLERFADPEILRWTPAEQVRAILVSRFKCRLERWDFDFLPGEADWGALDNAGIEVPPHCSGQDSRTRPPAVLMDERRSTAGQSESETLRP